MASTSHVFLSYSRKDSDRVEEIVAGLEAEGLNVWMDRHDIRGGELWREAIVEAIDRAFALVLMLSPDSAASDNVRREVDLAEGAGKPLVPVLLAAVQLTAKLRFQLAGIQWIEYYKDPEAKQVELVEVLSALQGKSGAGQGAPARELEVVIRGADLTRLDSAQKEQLQAQLIGLIADFTDTPRTEINLVKMTAGSLHAFLTMPAASAYKLKTAALNRDGRLIDFGIHALRLSGDRKYVLLETGSTGLIGRGRPGGRSFFAGGLPLLITAIIAIAIISVGLPPVREAIGTLLATRGATPTQTLTPSLSDTATPTPTPSETGTSSPTRSSTTTLTPTSTRMPTPTATLLPTPTPTPNPPTTFGDPSVSTKQFYAGGDACSMTQRQVGIDEAANDPNGISQMDVLFRLADKDSTEKTDWQSLRMTHATVMYVGFWTRRIYSSEIDFPSNFQGDYWFQFYFDATDKTGSRTKSPTHGKLVTLSICGWLH